LSGNKELISLLLEYTANRHIENHDGYTALDIAKKRSHDEIAGLLDINQSDIIHTKGEDKVDEQQQLNHLLFDAIVQGDLKRVIELLEKGANAETKNVNGYTPLMHAISLEQKNIVEELLSKQVNTESKNRYGETALILSAIHRKHDYVSILLTHGANINHKDNEGSTALHKAVHNNDLELVEILIKHNALIDIENKDNYTPLYISLLKNDIQIARKLLENGADIKHSINDTTIKKRAKDLSNKAFVELLKEFGSEEK